MESSASVPPSPDQIDETNVSRTDAVLALLYRRRNNPGNHAWLLQASRTGVVDLSSDDIQKLTGGHGILIAKVGGGKDFNMKTATAEALDKYTHDMDELMRNFREEVKPFQQLDDDRTSREQNIVRNLEDLCQSKTKWDTARATRSCDYASLVKWRTQGDRLLSYRKTRKSIMNIFESNCRNLDARISALTANTELPCGDQELEESLVNARNSCRVGLDLITQLNISASPAEVKKVRHDVRILHNISNDNAKKKIRDAYISGWSCEDSSIAFQMVGCLRIGDIMRWEVEEEKNGAKSKINFATEVLKSHVAAAAPEKKDIKIERAKSFLSRETVNNMSSIADRYQYQLNLEEGPTNASKRMAFLASRIVQLQWEHSLWKSKIGKHAELTEGISATVPSERFDDIVRKLRSNRKDKDSRKWWTEIKTLDDDYSSIIKSADSVVERTHRSLRDAIRTERDSVAEKLRTAPKDCTEIKTALKMFLSKAKLDLMEMDSGGDPLSQDALQQAREEHETLRQEYARLTMADESSWSKLKERLPQLIDAATSSRAAGQGTASGTSELEKDLTLEDGSGTVDEVEDTQSSAKPASTWASIARKAHELHP